MFVLGLVVELVAGTVVVEPLFLINSARELETFMDT